MLFAVIGHPVAHSLSPLLHSISFKMVGIRATYVKVDVPPERLEDFMKSADLVFKGLNVTIPHKVEVLKYVDEEDELVREVGAANVLKFEDGKVFAYNTDVIGVRMSIEDVINPKGLKVAVLGAGGAARAAVVAFKDVAKVTIFNRTVERAAALASEFGAEYSSLKDIEKIREHDIIINATPVGMDGASSPVPPEALRKGQVVMDMVYRPLYTPLLKMAMVNGAKAVNGLKMLVIQGVESERLWLGRAPPWREVYEKLLASLTSPSYNP